jgi:Xaa-Pro aminopeptidase
VTRTIAIGTPSDEMRDRYTRVLKGHIALARAIFPVGTRGSQLDTLARQFLWEVGLDYAHGTGHGVGSFLAVHEGPQRISPASSGFAGGDEPLAPGMIVSNEPGYYKAGEYGIRIENLVLVEPREAPGAEKKLLGFRTLTFAPLDRRLIDLNLLTPEERAWVDGYHAQVAALIGPQLDGDAAEWLRAETAPL